VNARVWSRLRLLAGLLAGLDLGCTFDGTVGVVAAATGATRGESGGSDESASSRGPGDSGLDSGDEACQARGGAPGPCSPVELPESFEAELKWSWTGEQGDTDTLVIPLVANLSDDNGDGRVDLCDVPDIVVTAGPPPPSMLGQPIPTARLYALDGATGAVHWVSAERIRATVTPALGDIDGDGLIEIVALMPSEENTDIDPYGSRLVIFDNQGQLVFEGDERDDFESTEADAIALADLDNDGDVEIMVADRVFDHLGETLFVANVGVESRQPLMPFGVDLDDDDDLEVLWGNAAYHHDGTPWFQNTGIRSGYAQVADLDDDGDPEIIVTTGQGLALVDHTGQILLEDIRLSEDPASETFWRRPAAIHDVDGDRRPELLVSAGSSLLALHFDENLGAFDLVWAVPRPMSLGTVSTAFDFLGDASAEAVYATQNNLFVYGEGGETQFQIERSSINLQDYAVVADVDNDRSAEIVVGSNIGTRKSSEDYPTLEVYGEVNNRWVQARRIWNQHTYHVTNIGETGQIPTSEPRHWRRNNTFRTNAQLEDGTVCLPEP